MGLSYSTIQRILRTLLEQNLIRRVGSKKTVFWSVVE